MMSLKDKQHSQGLFYLYHGQFSSSYSIILRIILDNGREDVLELTEERNTGNIRYQELCVKTIVWSRFHPFAKCQRKKKTHNKAYCFCPLPTIPTKSIASSSYVHLGLSREASVPITPKLLALWKVSQPWMCKLQLQFLLSLHRLHFPQLFDTVDHF